MQVKIGHFEPDGELIYLPIGFVPDYFFMLELGGGAAAVVMYHWFKMQETDEASGSQEGVSVSEGTTAVLADDGGIVAYDSESGIPTIVDWSAGLTVVARTVTAHGTYIRPSTSSAANRQAVFEVLENTTTGTTEPTWPAEIGGQVYDNHGSPVLYERVNVATERGGYKGVRIAAALMTDGQEMYYRAEEADQSEDHGDVVGWTGGIYGA